MKISVVIPTYNRAKTIEYCLQSVFNQSLQPHEIIIADDCSTDETLSVVRTLNYPIVKIVKLEKNSGAQAARNLGIKEADGDWIAFQDSDDIWKENKLELQYEAAKKYDFREDLFIHGDCELVHVKENRKEIWSLHRIEGNEAYKTILSKPGPTFPSILVTKKQLVKVGLLDEEVPSYQEWDTSIRLARISKVIHLQVPLFDYIIHAGDTISKNKNRDVEGYNYIVTKFKNEMLTVFGSDDVWIDHLKVLFEKSIRYDLYERAADFLDKIPTSDKDHSRFHYCLEKRKMVSKKKMYLEKILNVLGFNI